MNQQIFKIISIKLLAKMRTLIIVFDWFWVFKTQFLDCVFSPVYGHKKVSRIIRDVLMLTERGKSKGKRTLRWDICLWNYFLKILKF